MKKKDYFDKVVNLMKGYERVKSNCMAEYNRKKGSGMYSQQYLNEEWLGVDLALRNESHAAIGKIGKIREDYEKLLDSEFDLTASRPDSNLQALVNSGVNLTKEEFKGLANKYKGSYINSRILHDFAEKNGYELRNVTTKEECLRAFDNFTRGVQNSMYTGGNFPVYSNSGVAQIKADSIVYNVENLPCDCFKTPDSSDEGIASIISMEMADRKRKERDIDDKAFLDGFWGREHKKEPEKESTLKEKIDALTAEEKADAKQISLLNGNGGEITEKELEYLQGDNYKEIVSERNADAGESE